MKKYEMSPFAESNTQSKLFQCTLVDAEKDESNSAAQTNLKLDSLIYILGIKYFVYNTNKTNSWTLHFDESKS